MGRVARALVIAALVLTAAACRVEGRVDVDVAANGSGRVTVGVGLDAQALERLGDPATELKTTDLTNAGWKVAKPAKAGTTTWLRATKAFRSPADLGRVLDEVGLLRSWRLSVTNGFASTTWKVSGQVVSDGTIDQFSDSKLKSALDGLPVGLTPAQEASALKSSGPIPLTVHVRLPAGTSGTTSYTVDVAGSRPVTHTVTATATRTDSRPVRWFLLAALLAALGFVWAVVGRLRRPRSHGRHARGASRSLS